MYELLRSFLYECPQPRHTVRAVMASQLVVGVRVRPCMLRPVPAGTLGHVDMVLISVPDMCFVQFDGEPSPTLMRAADLDLVTEAPADEDYT